jgi:putative hydrolase of the HAD superfamily
MFVFFDLDDTLLDYQSAMRAAAGMFWADHLNVFGAMGRETFVAQWESLAARLTQQSIAGEIPWEDQRRLRMTELFAQAGRAITPYQAEELFGRYFEHFKANWRLYPDVRPCLDELAGLPMGIISNGEDHQQRNKLAATHIIDRFKVIVISSAAGVHKPERAIFRHACEMAECRPRDCVFVGDQLVTDALAAREVGMEGIWLNRRRLFMPGCDVETIESLVDLPDLLGMKRREWV